MTTSLQTNLQDTKWLPTCRPEVGRLYQQARRWREEVDYADKTVIDETLAQQILADAEPFVERLSRYLREIDAL